MVIFGALLGAGILIFAEILFRFFGPPPKPIPQKDQIIFFRTAAETFFKEKTINGEPALVQRFENDALPPPQTFPLRKKPGVRRIFVLGESNAKILGRLLQKTIGSNTEVLNWGIDGSTLEHLSHFFNEAARYSPDTIVIFFGHNLMYFYPPLKSWQASLLHISRQSMLLSHFASRPPPSAPIDFSSRLAGWKNFLIHAGQTSRRDKFQVVVFIPQANFWQEPETTESERNAIYRGGPDLKENKRRETIRNLERLVEQQPTAFGHYTLAKWLYENGQYKEARGHFQVATDLDPAGNRVRKAFNRLTREIALQENFVLADLETIVDEEALHGIPGWDLFHDPCHLREDKEFLLLDVALAALRQGKSSPKLSTQGNPGRQNTSVKPGIGRTTLKRDLVGPYEENRPAGFTDSAKLG